MFSQAGKQYLALLGVGCQEDDNKGKGKLDKKNLKRKMIKIAVVKRCFI